MNTVKLLAKSNWRYFTFSAFWVSFIVLLSLWSGNDIPSTQSYVLEPDKLIHFTLYFVFTFSIFIALKKVSYRSGLKRSNSIAFGLALILALVTEVLQLATLNRNFDYKDLLANLFGIIIAGLVLRLIVGKDIFFKLN